MKLSLRAAAVAADAVRAAVSAAFVARASAAAAADETALSLEWLAPATEGGEPVNSRRRNGME